MLVTDNRDLKLDSSNSLVLEGGDLVWTTGILGVIQACRIKLLMFKGEWFLDRTKGMSYWGEILGQKPDRAIAALQSEVFSQLKSVEDVVDVTKLDVQYNPQTRQITVRWSVRCEFGNTAVQTLSMAL